MNPWNSWQIKELSELQRWWGPILGFWSWLSCFLWRGAWSEVWISYLLFTLTILIMISYLMETYFVWKIFINCKRVVCETKVISVNNGVMESRSTLISSKLWLTVERWWACTKADEAETLVSQQTCDKVALSFYTRRKHAATCCDLMMQLFSSVGVAKLWFCSHELYFGNTWLK